MSKEKFRNILISFMCDYDNNKWSNDDVYDKYSIVLSQMFNDLEAKLAEKDRQLKVMRELKNRHFNYYKTCETECSQLKQQLAEKEFEIKKLNTRILVSQLQAPEEQRLKIIGSSCCQYNSNQDKISFAVEKLEEVKEFALELFKKFCQSTEYHSNKSLVGRRFIEYYPFNDFIDNQIKILREGK